MILFDCIKYFESLDMSNALGKIYSLENLNIIASRDHEVDAFILPLRNKLLEYGFDKVDQLEIVFESSGIKNFFFFKEKDVNFIAFWKANENNNIPLIFDIEDIISNDLDYNILKYGKILLKEIE